MRNDLLAVRLSPIYTDRLSGIHRAAQSIAATGTPAAPAAPATPAASAAPDYITELKRLAELRDMGIITAEDFEAKKNQLLGL